MLAPGAKGQQFWGRPSGRRCAPGIKSHTHAPGLRPGLAESASAHSAGPQDSFLKKCKSRCRRCPKLVNVPPKCFQHLRKGRCTALHLWMLRQSRSKVGPRVSKANRRTAPKSTSWAKRVVESCNLGCHFGSKSINNRCKIRHKNRCRKNIKIKFLGCVDPCKSIILS